MAALRLSVLTVVLLASNPLPTAGKCNPREVAALWRLYELTGGASWRMNTNWDPLGDPCAMNARWVGVGVSDPCKRWYDGEHCYLGRITSLYLQGNRLNGSISNWTQLGAMRNLTLVDLSENELRGEIPTEIGRLSKLERLTMRNNQLEGTLPTELGLINSPAFVSDLTEFNLQSNQISGTIPSELSVHSRLRMVDLRTNGVSGTLPSQLATLRCAPLLHPPPTARPQPHAANCKPPTARLPPHGRPPRPGTRAL